MINISFLISHAYAIFNMTATFFIQTICSHIIILHKNRQYTKAHFIKSYEYIIF